MTLRFVVAPAADRALFRRVMERCDQILGFPRTHSASESGVKVSSGKHPVTDAAFVVWLHDNSGAAILQGAVAAQVNDYSLLLADRFIEHNAVRKRLREWIQDRGWEVRADLPGVRAAWSRIAHRDGGTGSATGVPIPEGQE